MGLLNKRLIKLQELLVKFNNASKKNVANQAAQLKYQNPEFKDNIGETEKKLTDSLKINNKGDLNTQALANQGDSPKSLMNPKPSQTPKIKPLPKPKNLMQSETIEFDDKGQWRMDSFSKASDDYEDWRYGDVKPTPTNEFKDVIDINKHGMGSQWNTTDKQRDLLHGIDLGTQTAPFSHFEDGATSNAIMADNNNSGKIAFIKRASHFGHHMHRLAGNFLGEDGLNSSKREVLFHDMANEFFGLGDHVPTTAGFSIGGDDWSAMEVIPDGIPVRKLLEYDKNSDSHIPNSTLSKILKKHHDDGTLHKIALMDVISGNHDRHSGNAVIDGDNKLWLIDHGSTFDYRNLNDMPPHYVDHTDMIGADNYKVHGEALKWLNSLDSNKAFSIMNKYKINPEFAEMFIKRLESAKKLANKGEFGHMEDMLNEIRMSTGPEYRDSEHARKLNYYGD